MSVVKKMWEKHARVQVPFYQITGITDKMLAKLLADGRPEWPLLRKVIQNMDLFLTSSHGVLNTKQMLSDTIVNKAYKMPLRLRSYLTDRISKLEYKSSVQGRAEDEATAEESAFLWHFPEGEPP